MIPNDQQRRDFKRNEREGILKRSTKKLFQKESLYNENGKVQGATKTEQGFQKDQLRMDSRRIDREGVLKGLTEKGFQNDQPRKD